MMIIAHAKNYGSNVVLNTSHAIIGIIILMTNQTCITLMLINSSVQCIKRCTEH